MLWLISATLFVGAFWAHMTRGPTKLFWLSVLAAVSVFSVTLYGEHGMPSYGSKGIGGPLFLLLRVFR